MDNDHEVKRDAGGRWLEKPRQAVSIETSERGRELARKRWDMYTDAARVAVIKACKDRGIDVTDSAGAYGVAVAAQYNALIDSEKPKFSDLLKFRDILLGKDTSDISGDPQRANVPGGAISAAPAVLMELVEMIEERQRLAAERARAIDV